MAIINQSGGGFSKKTLLGMPAEWLFISNTTWIAPITATYKVTVVGRGGDGSSVVFDGSLGGGSGGGSGGWCEKTVTIAQGTQYVITVSRAVSSFGSVMSATAGGNAFVLDVGVGGSATGGDVNHNGKEGSKGWFLRDTYGDWYMSGGNGGVVANDASSKYLSSPPQTLGSEFAVSSKFRNPFVLGMIGFVEGSKYLPFGTGGVGGTKSYVINGESTVDTHSLGITGMVAIEVIL